MVTASRRDLRNLRGPRYRIGCCFPQESPHDWEPLIFPWILAGRDSRLYCYHLNCKGCDLGCGSWGPWGGGSQFPLASLHLLSLLPWLRILGIPLPTFFGNDNFWGDSLNSTLTGLRSPPSLWWQPHPCGLWPTHSTLFRGNRIE